MRRETLIAGAVLLFVLVFDPARASAETGDRLAGFDAVAAKGAVDWEIPGLAVSVVKDGEVVFARGYGVLELGKPAAADENTLFAIGSTTKAMTAAAIGMLVDEGK